MICVGVLTFSPNEFLFFQFKSQNKQVKGNLDDFYISLHLFLGKLNNDYARQFEKHAEINK